MKQIKKSRIDQLVVDRGLTASRTRAKALIMAGRVYVDGRVVDKAGSEVKIDSVITVTEDLPFVSRGGLKLAGALKEFSIDVKGLTAVDIGSSTGGFTDCLLKSGVGHVYAIDVGKGLLDWTLRNDERVTVIEGQNIRHLPLDLIPVKADMAVIDVSFISLEKVLPRSKELIKNGGTILALIKPQFEVGKGEVGKGGIVKDPEKHRKVIERIKEFSIGIGLNAKAVTESPIKGAKGNIEFLIYLTCESG
ncbi:MAG: TlyA family RNA methyltransferase [Thermodesulfobacteriota bacterium]